MTRRTRATTSRAWGAVGRLVLAVDITCWLRPDAHTSPERILCHTYGRGKDQHIMIPGWPYSVVVALEPGRSSWTAPLDAQRRLSAPAPPQAWARLPPSPTRRAAWAGSGELPIIAGTVIRLQVDRLP